MLIITSSDSPRDRSEIARLGIAGYFRKPPSYQEFSRSGRGAKGSPPAVLTGITGCNRLHSIDERARWLLLTHDRVGGDEFIMTQEFLGQMLGVRRASVNTVASVFQ